MNITESSWLFTMYNFKEIFSSYKNKKRRFNDYLGYYNF